MEIDSDIHERLHSLYRILIDPNNTLTGLSENESTTSHPLLSYFWVHFAHTGVSSPVARMITIIQFFSGSKRFIIKNNVALYDSVVRDCHLKIQFVCEPSQNQEPHYTYKKK